jgi:hypothetical protein
MLRAVNLPALRWRRLGAGLVDFTPFILAMGMMLPMLLGMGLLAVESFFGIGIFDPAVGADPVLLTHMAGQQAPAAGTAVVTFAWVALEVLALAGRGRSIGKGLFGLAAESSDGKPLGHSRATLREVPRLGLALAVMVVVALGAPRGFPRGNATAIVPTTIAAFVVVLLASALATHLAADIGLLLAGKRSLADRLARTRVLGAEPRTVTP